MYPDATSSTSPTTDPPVPPPPLTTAETRTIRWRARGGFAEAWAWRCEGFTGYRPFLHALACALVLGFAGCGGGSAEVAEAGTTAARADCPPGTETPQTTLTAGGQMIVYYCGGVSVVPVASIAVQAAAARLSGGK